MRKAWSDGAKIQERSGPAGVVFRELLEDPEQVRAQGSQLVAEGTAEYGTSSEGFPFLEDTGASC